jgi:hypothetical protein
MQSYRPPISRSQYHDLEIYYHKLVAYTISWDFRDLKGDKQALIFQELTYMEMTLNILSNLFAKPDGIEKPVIGWKINIGPEDPHLVQRFSSVKVAAGATGCNQSKVSAVCKEKRPYTGTNSLRDAKTGKIISVDHYKFVYEEDYKEEEETTIDHLINKSDEEETIAPDGDV